MFYVYGKISKEINGVKTNIIRVYDDVDLTIDECTVSEIQSYIKMGIEIAGVSSTMGTSHIRSCKPSGLHLIKGCLLNEVAINFMSDYWKSSKDTYSVMCNSGVIGVVDFDVLGVSLKLNMLEPTLKLKGRGSKIIKYLLSKYLIEYIIGYCPSNTIAFFEKVGATFNFDTSNYKSSTVESHFECEFVINK